uniref:hypothetical protein n=1 Tax=Trichocoleus desertorum TaxID=1481672 RepID=UPI0025B44329|nr:hypothetical protein [Trichocoleus desertorum]
MRLPIHDHDPSPEEWATVTSLSDSEIEAIARFRESHREPFAELIEGALWETGAMREVQLKGWDTLKEGA